MNLKSLKNKISKNLYDCHICHLFKKDEQGRDIYFPKGPAEDGYIVEDKQKYEKQEKRDSLLFFSTFFLFILFIPLIVSAPKLIAGIYLWLYFAELIWISLVRRKRIKLLQQNHEKVEAQLKTKEYFKTLMNNSQKKPGLPLYLVLIGTQIWPLLYEVSHDNPDYEDLLFTSAGIAVFTFMSGRRLNYLAKTGIISSDFPGIARFAAETIFWMFLIGICLCVFISLLMLGMKLGLIIWGG